MSDIQPEHSFLGLPRLLRRHQDALLLASLALVHLVTSVLWLRADEVDMMRVPDDFAHYWGLANLHAAMSLDLFDGTLNGLRVMASNYPMIAQLPRAAAGLLLGPSPLVFRAANVVYLVVLLVSIYHIGRRCHGRRAGLLAAALVSLTPAVYGGARSMGLDYPAMCITSLAMLLLLRTEGFRRLPDTVGFGVCAGLAVLAKGQSALFLVWPAIFILGRELWLTRPRGLASLWRPLAGGTLAVLVLLLTTAVWWGGRLGQLLKIMGAHTTGDGMLEVAGDITLWGGIIHYAQALPMVLSAPMAAVTLLVLPAFFRHTRQRWVILAWLVAPLVLHVVLSVRHPRYIFPLVPAAALVLAVGICSLRPRLRSVAAATVGTLAVAAWIACSCLSPPDHMGWQRPLCYKQPDLWHMRGPAKLSSVAEALATCGSCEYAGPPSAPRSPETAKQVARLTRLLGGQDAPGEGILVYTDGVYRAVQTMVMVRQRLPSMLFLDVLFAKDLLPSKPVHQRRTFVLWDVKKAPPGLGLVRLNGEPLRIELEPSMHLDVHLYRLKPSSGWPHPRSPE